MLYFVQTFEAAEGIGEAEIVETLIEGGKRWGARYPGMYLVGVFVRRFRLGPRPDYMALWMIPDAAIFDEWRSNTATFPELVEMGTRFSRVTRMVEARLMEGFGTESVERAVKG